MFMGGVGGWGPAGAGGAGRSAHTHTHTQTPHTHTLLLLVGGYELRYLPCTSYKIIGVVSVVSQYNSVYYCDTIDLCTHLRVVISPLPFQLARACAGGAVCGDAGTVCGAAVLLLYCCCTVDGGGRVGLAARC
jgi:hypothetical protein